VAGLSQLNSRYGARSLKQLGRPAAQAATHAQGAGSTAAVTNAYVIEFDSGVDAAVVAQEYGKQQSVVHAHPDYLIPVHQTAPTDEPRYAEQWAHPQTRAPLAWATQTGSPDVVVGVIDTGVAHGHQDLQANIWRDADGNPGHDFVTVGRTVLQQSGVSVMDGEDYDLEDGDPNDYLGHGTHCAGIVAAAVNGLGVAGVAPNVRIMPLRAGFAIGTPTAPVGTVQVSAIVGAIDYAIANGADVLSMSFGFAVPVAEMEAALTRASTAGITLVASAGNGGVDLPNYPASYPNVISVAASDIGRERANYSQFGYWVDVAAPGGENGTGQQILSTVPLVGSAWTDPSGYRGMQGTSMAAPYVAGMAALIKSQVPEATPADIRGRLVGSVQAMSGSFNGLAGAGIVDVPGALSAAPSPVLKIVGSEIREVGGNQNGVLELGETAAVEVELKNLWKNARGVNASLIATSGDVVVTHGNWAIGNVAAQQTVTSSNVTLDFRVNATGDVSTELQLALTGVDSSGVPFAQSLPIQVTLGVAQLSRTGDLKLQPRALRKAVTYIKFDITTYKFDLVVHDLATGQATQITDYPVGSFLSQAPGPVSGHGDRFVWHDMQRVAGGPDIHLYDVATHTARVVSAFDSVKLNPDVFGNRVVWQDYRNGDYDLYQYDLVSGQESVLVAAPGEQQKPRISGDRVAWEDTRNGTVDIYLYDLTTGTETALLTSAADEKLHDLVGNQLVYSRNTSDTGTDIRVLDLDTGAETLVLEPPIAHDVTFSADRIAWRDSRDGKNSVYLYDLRTGQERRITQHPAGQSDPSLIENYLVWMDQRAGYQVFFTEVAPNTGDVNWSGKTDIVDAQMIARYYVGQPPAGFHVEAADATCNGAVDITDALRVARYYVGLEPQPFCTGE
jgi:beta propeller repeat protein